MQEPSRFSISSLTLTSVNSVEISDNKHFVFRCIVKFNELSDDLITSFDTGATGETFMNKKYAQQRGIFPIFLIRPIPLQSFDGNVTGSGPVTHFAYVLFAPLGHKPQLTRFFLIDIPQFPIIINLPWMRNKFTMIRRRPDISTIDFEQLDKINEPVITPEPMETFFSSSLIAKSSNYQFPSVKKIPDERKSDPIIEKLPTHKKRKFPGQRSQEKKKARILKRGEEFPQFPELVKPFDELPETPFEIKMIAAAPFFHVSKRKGVKLFSASLKNVEKTLRLKQRTDLITKLLSELHEFLELFSKKKKKKKNYHHINHMTTKSNS